MRRHALLLLLVSIGCVGDSIVTDGGLDASLDGAPTDSGVACDGGQICGSQCIDTQTSATNCGACGNVCASGFACTSGRCGEAVDDIASGSYFSCVLRHEGTVWCWGDNEQGELGHASASDPTCGAT